VLITNFFKAEVALEPSPEYTKYPDLSDAVTRISEIPSPSKSAVVGVLPFQIPVEDWNFRAIPHEVAAVGLTGALHVCAADSAAKRVIAIPKINCFAIEDEIAIERLFGLLKSDVKLLILFCKNVFIL
jgi:hypothetical protein